MLVKKMKIKNFKKDTKQETQPKALRLGGQAGQVVLMVLLASALVLTLGLSASRQATVETKIDTDQELLKKAFNTAESGIEYYFGTGGTAYDAGNNNGSANLSVKTVGDSETLSFGNVILNGSTDYFWLVKHNDDGSLSNTEYYSTPTIPNSLNICTVSGEKATFKINYFYKLGTDYKVQQSTATTVDGCVSNFDLTAGNSLLLSIMPIGSDVKIKLTGPVKFPGQGEEISSVGKVEGVNNTVTVLNKYFIPTFLLDAVTSGGDVTSK